MPQLHLPEQHSDADLILAGQIAAIVGSGELYIAWTHDGGPGALPTVPAHLRAPVHPLAEILGVLIVSATEVWRALTRPGAAPENDASRPASN